MYTSSFSLLVIPHVQCERGKVISVGFHIIICIRECGSTVCRIDGDVLDTNTKVYGDGHALIKHFFHL